MKSQLRGHGWRTPDAFRNWSQKNPSEATRLGGLTIAVFAILLAGANPAWAASRVEKFPLKDTKNLALVNVKAAAVEYEGRKCVLVTTDGRWTATRKE